MSGRHCWGVSMYCSRFDGGMVKTYFGRIFDTDPVVHFSFRFLRRKFDLGDVFHDLMLELSMAVTEVLMESKLHAESAEKLVCYHGHLVLGKPLWVFVWVIVKQMSDTRCIQQGISQELQPLVVRNLLPGVGT